MALRVCKRFFYKVLCITSVLISPSSFAFSQKIPEQILQQSPDSIKFGLVAIAAVLGFLLLLVIFFKLQLSSERKKQLLQHKNLADKQSLLNDFKVGMLHVNLAGEIIFANRVAAFFLGSKEDKLINRPLIEVFDENVQQSISTALASNKYMPLQTYVTGSKRHLQLGFAKQSNTHHGISCVVSLADVSNYQHKINQQSDDLNSLHQGLQQSGLARLTINLEDNSFTSDQLFADLLHATEPLSGQLNQFKTMLNNKTMFEWEQALEASKNLHEIDINCEFLLSTKNQSDSFGSEPQTALNQNQAQGQDTIPLRLIGFSSNKNDKGETTGLDFMVHNLSAIEAQKSLHHTSQQQVKTLLATSPHPVYLLDEQGQFIDCNPAFESMFKQKLSKIKHKKHTNVKHITR